MQFLCRLPGLFGQVRRSRLLTVRLSVPLQHSNSFRTSSLVFSLQLTFEIFMKGTDAEQLLVRMPESMTDE
jgi:hypothetical protein